ncbi:hypothetical protein [Nonomuraea soli]|uniref:Uncharacterized protein n=1 Tax=Nonomuraea soli TaxID=1032476 RepID=A0A7W0CR40_9ACTN|nr:hypothetical protein [Nonomuraea soli]MBA2895791.1 hypothetical protein [Nonomuraea soli]
MRLHFSRSVVVIIVIVVVLAVAISVAVLKLLEKVEPFVEPQAKCTVTTPRGELELDVEQAQISATIAAVAARRKLPERAVIIAYATGIQESKLYNLDYGDRDSLGVFQQRPSQGWGTPKQIMDPVYSTNKFFAALVKVKNYRKLPIADAAQAVQRSAGGYAYADHEEDARILAAAFTGRVPKAVHCTYPAGASPSPTSTAYEADRARRDLTKALGGTATAGVKRGWLIATWSVAHAQKYGLRKVGFDGATWSPQSETWTSDSRAGRDEVALS